MSTYIVTSEKLGFSGTTYTVHKEGCEFYITVEEIGLIAPYDGITITFTEGELINEELAGTIVERTGGSQFEVSWFSSKLIETYYFDNWEFINDEIIEMYEQIDGRVTA